jgi:hypothetical protein
MRHDLCACPIAPGARGVREAAATARLVAAPGRSDRAAARLRRTRSAAVDLAAIAAAADDHLSAATAAQKQTPVVVGHRRSSCPRALDATTGRVQQCTPHSCPAQCGARRRITSLVGPSPRSFSWARRLSSPAGAENTAIMQRPRCDQGLPNTLYATRLSFGGTLRAPPKDRKRTTKPPPPTPQASPAQDRRKTRRHLSADSDSH